MYADDEIDLVDLFLVLWRRKVMIVAITILATFAGVGVSLYLPEVYEVKTIIEPAKDAEGNMVRRAEVIRESIAGGAYNEFLNQKYTVPGNDIPKFNVSVPKNTDLVIASMETQNPELAVKILQKTVALISADIQEELDLKIQETQNRISRLKLKDQQLGNTIALLESQMVDVKSIVKELTLGKGKAMASPREDAMAVLLYSNEIKNQQTYLNNLQEKLINIQTQKQQIQYDIDDVRIKLEGIKSTKVHKVASVPKNPIKPKKPLIVALSLILGFMGSIFLAFGAEFMTKVRQQQAEKEE
ncbi:MAG: Wzz/FepE/Etk N-terminal domain-containing protein [Desulfuromonadaceae bacterium]|nr:Wzz/FepE/Etk N-terminal domain-containing protein [Desulfuromonadaceae bacterium]